MSLARGLGAAFEGFSKGVRLAGEEEDRKTRQELAKKQLEAADLALAKEREESDYRSEIKRLYADAEKNARGGTSGEVVDEFGVNLGRMTYLGDNRPEAGGLQFTGEQKQVAPRSPDTDPAYAQELLMRENAIKQKYGKMTRLEALKGVADFGKLMSTGAADAANYFISSGDEPGALKMLRERGNMNLPEGTRLVPKTEKLFPEGPDAPWNTRKTFDVMSPDGAKLADYGAITRRAMDAKDVFNLDTEQGKAMLNYTHQMKTIAETTRHNGVLESLKGQELINAYQSGQAVLERLKRSTAIQEEQLRYTRDAKDALALDKLFGDSQQQIFRLAGFKETTPDKLLTDKDKAEYFASQRRGAIGTGIFQANVDVTKKAAALTPMESLQLADSYILAQKDPNARAKWESLIKFDDSGMPYVERGNKKIVVPLLPEVEKPSAGGPAPKPSRPGISTPAAQPKQSPEATLAELETRELESGRRRDYSPETKAYFARLEAERKAASEAENAAQAERMRQQEIARGRAAYQQGIATQ